MGICAPLGAERFDILPFIGKIPRSFHAAPQIDADIPDLHVSCIKRAWEQCHPRLQISKCHRQICLERRPKHLPRRRINTGRNVHRHFGCFHLIHPLQDPGIPSFHLSGKTDSKQGVKYCRVAFLWNFPFHSSSDCLKDADLFLCLLCAMIRIACEHHRHLCPFLQQETSYRNPISAVISTATHNQASGDINLFLFDRFYHLQGRPLHQYKGRDPDGLNRVMVCRFHCPAVYNIVHPYRSFL